MNSGWCAGIGAALVALSLSALAQGPGLQAARVAGVVERERDAGWESLEVAARIYDGERVRTGSNGRAELLLAGAHPLLLGSNGRLVLYSSEAPNPPSRMGLAKLVLDHGALRIEAGGSGGRPPADLRVNVGPLRMRIFGAEAWIEATPAGEEVCLLRGAIEIQTPDGAERLDHPGECLRWGSMGALRLSADVAGSLDARLALTALEPAAAMPAETVTAALAAAADESAPAATTEPVAAETEIRRWRLVLASLPTEAAAMEEVGRLKAKGIDAIIEPGQIRGRATYRLTFGDYATRAEAQQALRSERALAPFPRAWPLQIP